MQHKIHKATNNDLPLMKRLFYQAVIMHGSKIFTKDEIKIYSRLTANTIYWQNKFENDHIYNAKLNGEVIGSFSMSSGGNIEYILVHQNYIGRGIARDLYKTIEEIAIKSSIEVLTTEINFLTKPFFEKYGFEIIKNAVKVVGGNEVVSYNGVKHLKN